jgi:hypothetical protein
MGVGHLDHLRHIRDTHDTRLICFSGAGFKDRIRDAARASPDVLLVDLPELYGTRPAPRQ